MFEMIQERDYGGDMSRTIVYVILHGDSEKEKPRRLTEQGKEQIKELSRSRIVAAPARIYTSSSKACKETADILAKELMSKTEEKGCLAELNLAQKDPDEDYLRDVLPRIWKDQTYAPPSGESIFDAQQRFATCVHSIARAHPENSVAIIAEPLVFALFYRIVVGGETQVEDWLYSGFASCATYEYSKNGWALIMPPENSFLSQPTDVASSLPLGLF